MMAGLSARVQAGDQWLYELQSPTNEGSKVVYPASCFSWEAAGRGVPNHEPNDEAPQAKNRAQSDASAPSSSAWTLIPEIESSYTRWFPRVTHLCLPT